MQKNISQNDINTVRIEAENILNIKALRTSKYPDSKNVFKHEEKEIAFKKRYGKDVSITVTYEGKDGSDIKSFDDLIEYTIRFETSSREHYAITEIMDNGQTKEILFSYRKNGKNYINSYKRYIDAEITLVDFISEET